MSLPQVPSFRLDMQPALVTGASSGIGEGCAVALAAMGASVTLVARGQDKLDALAASMQEAGYNVRAAAIDINDINAVRSLCGEQAKSAEGPFRAVVNSAGIARHTPSLETQPADFDTVMSLNVRAAYFLMQAVAKELINAGLSGSLINIGSQMGSVGGVDRAVYCATKHATEGFIKAMAIEWGKHQIRINSICPTFVRTPLTEVTFAQPERVAWIKSKIHLGRIGEVSDIMGAVQYLASDASALVTGTSMLIDGGWTAE